MSKTNVNTFRNQPDETGRFGIHGGRFVAETLMPLILNVEKASFTPLAFTTTGGVGRECTKLIKQLAKKIATKRQEQYCHVVAFLRTKLRFSLLKATLVAIRGIRGRQLREDDVSTNIDYNLIPRSFEL